MAATLDDILSSHRTGRAIVMGILNVTPDSFSDGGRFLAVGDAVAQAERMIAEGADVIDIGAESTRPGGERVSPAEQIDRLGGILPAVAAAGARISIDTTNSEVARFALDTGATIVNDVSAGRDDPAIFALAAERGAPICLMHMLGAPKTMQADPHYDDVVAEVCDFLAQRRDAAVAAGVVADRIILDPGIGFGKRLEHNLALIRHVDRVVALGHPVLVGPSRKRFIGEVTGIDAPDRRGAGTLAASLACWRGGATIFRVHDVAAAVQAFAVARAIESMQ
ncbi:hypothetical protein LCGC14_0123780 [marine sediment metagenome]|uniref:dihydropteroate synthase n=1 Tax=marine sediment metagenome TaxID=412755 RepID=A0A0F9V5T3_9ZZZZ|nr:dihydropteroate synthase [Phycisphaerae bacterium]HDZ43109.1 dihydropteroate synthase [Phycisphaerae bacterium]